VRYHRQVVLLTTASGTRDKDDRKDIIVGGDVCSGFLNLLDLFLAEPSTSDRFLRESQEEVVDFRREAGNIGGKRRVCLLLISVEAD
jgi:hypothetical protein